MHVNKENFLSNSVFHNQRFRLSIDIAGPTFVTEPDFAQRVHRLIECSASGLGICEAMLNLVWGHYAVELHDVQTDTVYHLPEPTGTMPVYYREAPQSVHVSTDLAEMVSKFGGNWDEDVLETFARTQFQIPGRTAFANIQVVPIGSLLIVEQNRHIQIKTIWPNQFETKENDAELCESKLELVCRHVAADNDRLTLLLSGGVDSSSAATLLKTGQTSDTNKINAAHLFSSHSPLLNEREYAQSVADKLGIDLMCVDIEEVLPFTDLELNSQPHIVSLRPMFNSFDKLLRKRMGPDAKLAEGQGGDLLFGAAPTTNVIVDAWADGGSGKAFETSKRLAILRNGSIVRNFMEAAKLRVATKMGISGADRRIGSQRLFTSNMDTAWHDQSGNNAENRRYLREHPAKREMLQGLQRFLGLFQPVKDDSYLSRVQPFLYQPVIEAALATPTHTTFDVQNDRLHLRQAALKRREIPCLRRTDKGSFENGVARGLKANEQEIKSLIREGVLVSSGRIKFEDVEKVYRDLHASDLKAALSLMLLTSIEVFCNSWQARMARC